MSLHFSNRSNAGKLLAHALHAYAKDPSAIVLALPRGGVPVAREVALALEIPSDVYVVRKVSVPFEPELAMGAVGSGGVRLIEETVFRRAGITRAEFDKAAEIEEEVVRRRTLQYRGDRPYPPLAGRTVILVDDGAATGATMLCAIRGVRQLDAAKVVVALPVAPSETVRRFESEADDVVVLSTPSPFFAVGEWYDDFSQGGG